MDKIREHVYLAALLHDIGKFYQRASDSLSSDGSNLSTMSNKLAEYICPLNQSGNFGYQHCIWTAEFLEKHKNIFKQTLGIKYENEQKFEQSLVHLAAYHHKPDSELTALISLADWWSAGIDRFIPKDEDKYQADNIQWGNDKYKKIPLYSIFNSINKGNANVAFPLQPLEISDKCFTKEIITSNSGNNHTKYKDLGDAFEKDFVNLPTDSFKGFADSLLYLLKKYAWCIPSSTVDMANVSLFEHLKTTAAFADCLYLYQEQNPNDFSFNSTTKRIKVDDGVFPVMLLGGDLSGIQKFIYNIASQKAAVSLKGRSFYLQLLMDSVIQRIISHPDIDVNIGNVVYSSGGKFYMLLPNTDNIKAAIAKLKEEFEQELFNDWKGQLSINMAYVPFAYCADSKEIHIEKDNVKAIGDLWKTLADKLTEQKNRKFQRLIEQSFDTMFEPIVFDKDAKICAVTGIEAKVGNAWNECTRLSDNDSPYVLNSVKFQAGLGQTLKDANYLLMENGVENNTYLINNVKCNNISFGVNTYLLDTLPRVTSADYTLIKKINDTDFLKKLQGQQVSFGFQFYGGNKQALNPKGEMKDFAALSSGSFLGVLRMDVDNLGSIFIKGLPEEQRSFAAYATLSFLLDWFFSGYLNTIRNANEFKDDVNILYSGGDDIFAVGRWDKLIEFAHKIRTEFAKFVGRDDISISGGIAIVGNKFPISKAAQLAGEAEDMAKLFNNNAKNAFCMFGETISWNEEFDFVKQWKNNFYDYCKNEQIPRSLLHKIMQLAEIKKRGDIKYIWHTIYYLSRFQERKKSDTAITGFCEKLKNELFQAPRNYDLITLAIRWAELELRKEAL
ncbi:MAG: type III-A CRISPR-associated protein Cas10/Csm1 [Culturomica sp.]|jgi:CRISPR-associated protein Csm1|nr:type III-A CRISPR-associated protein Cas10/Csm1 [Culturomica sp.]